MKDIKRRICTILILALLFTVIQPSVSHAQSNGGIQGDGWRISEDYVLTISKFVVEKDGEGILNNEWEEYRQHITEIRISGAEIVEEDKESNDSEQASKRKGRNWRGLFKKMRKLEKVTINKLDLSKVSDVSDMFYDDYELKNVSINWSLGEQTKDISGMFAWCDKLTKVNIANWNVENVKDMSDMFYNCVNLSYINLIKWQVKKDTDISGMFHGCVNLDNCTFADTWESDGEALEGCFSYINDYSWAWTDCLVYGNSPFINEHRLTWLKEMPGKYMTSVRKKHQQKLSTHHEDQNHFCEIDLSQKVSGSYADDTADRAKQKLNNTRLTIYENDKDTNNISDKSISRNVNIENGTQTVINDENGNAELDTAVKDKVRVCKEGYVTRELTESQISVSKEIKMQKKSSEHPVISAVWIEKDYDVLNQYYNLDKDDTSEKEMRAEVDWGVSSYGEIQLTQGKAKEKFEGDELFLSFGDTFDVSQPIYIVATDKDGRSIQQKLYFQNDPALKMKAKAKKEQTIKELQLADENLNKDTLGKNVYLETVPQLVSYKDGNKLAVWQEGSLDDINSISLYYSYFNGEKWSEPQEVMHDSTLDCAPKLKCIDNVAYLTWQNSSQKIDGKDIDKNMTLGEICSKKKVDFDIGAAIFSRNDQGGEFITTTIKNENLDTMPQLVEKSGDAYVVWVNNSHNDYFGEGANNTIFISKIYEDSGEVLYEEPKAVYKNLNAISGLTADYNNRLKIAYSMDEDGNPYTEDSHVYENCKRVSNQTQEELKPVYVDHSLYWYCDNQLVDKEGTIQNSSISSSQYEIIQMENRTAVVYSKKQGTKTGVYLAYLNESNHSWENSVKIAEYEKEVRNVCANVTYDGMLNVLVNLMETEKSSDAGEDKNLHTTSMLEVISCKKVCDIGVSEAAYEANKYVAGDWINITYTISNSGTEPVSRAVAKIQDKQGNELASTYVQTIILPGQSVQTKICFKTLEDQQSQDVVLSVQPYSGVDDNTENNLKEIHLEYEDLMVENVTCGQKNDVSIISADVVNRGYKPHDDIKVKLVKGSQNGEVIAETQVKSLESFRQKTVSFSVQASDRDIYYVTIEQKDDLFKENNSGAIQVTTVEKSLIEPTPTVRPTVEATPIVEPAATPKQQLEEGSKERDYSEDSTKRELNSKEVTVSGIVYKVGKNTAEAYKVKKKSIKSVVIPDTINYRGNTYKVTSIASNICKNNKKLKKLIIGRNVVKIGSNAFFKCKNLKKIVFKTTKLSKKKVGKKAFYGLSKRVQIKVPKRKNYKKWILH